MRPIKQPESEAAASGSIVVRAGVTRTRLLRFKGRTKIERERYSNNNAATIVDRGWATLVDEPPRGVRNGESVEGIALVREHGVGIEIQVKAKFLLINNKLRGGNTEAGRGFVVRGERETNESVQMLGDGISSADDVAVHKLTGAGSEL